MEPALADARPSCYPVAVAAVPVTPGFSSGQSCRNPSCSQDPLRSPLGWDSHADPLGSWVTLCPARPSPRCYGVVVQTPWRGGPGPGPRAGRPGSEICFRFATFYWGLLVTHPDLILVPVQCQEHRILLTTARPSALGPARALLLCRAVSTGPLSAGCHWLPHPCQLCDGLFQSAGPTGASADFPQDVGASPSTVPRARPRGVSSGHRGCPTLPSSQPPCF